MEEKEKWMIILNKANEIATEVFNRLVLPPGSYTASDVHKHLMQKWGGYLKRRNCHMFCNVSGEERYDFKYDYCHKIQCCGITVSIPTPHLFYTITQYEKCAGVKPKDRHIWVKESPHTLIGVAEVCFPSTAVAKGIPALMNAVCNKNHECMVWLPSKNRLIGDTGSYIAYDTECKVEGELDFPDIAFKFNTSAMKRIYGRCTVELYIDKKGRHSVVITNEAGLKTYLDTSMSDLEIKVLSKKLDASESIEDNKETDSTEDNTEVQSFKRRYDDDFDPHSISQILKPSEGPKPIQKVTDTKGRCHRLKSPIALKWYQKRQRFSKQFSRHLKRNNKHLPDRVTNVKICGSATGRTNADQSLTQIDYP